MNLIEHYIKEIHSVEKITREWGSFILVDLTHDSYGCIKRTEESFSSWVEWEQVKAKGYYLG